MDGIAEIGTKLAARGRGCTCQWNAVALLSNLRRRWRADDSRELQGGVEEDRGEARFDGPPAAPPLSASPAPAPAPERTKWREAQREFGGKLKFPAPGAKHVRWVIYSRLD